MPGGLIFWNVRGLSRKAAKHSIRCLNADLSPSVFSFLEMWIQDFDDSLFHSIFNSDCNSFCIPATGYSGGIVLCWRSNWVNVDIVAQNQQFILAKLVSAPLPPIFLGGIYASYRVSQRKDLWRDLGTFLNPLDPLIIGGDFNCILHADEKKGGRPFSFNEGTKDFENFITCNNLLDAGFVGPKFTWCNNRRGIDRIWKRLDRVLINNEVAALLPNLLVRHLARVTSDHCPLLVSFSDLAPSTKPIWRFEDAWLTCPKSHAIVAKIWDRLPTNDPLTDHESRIKRTIRGLHFFHKGLRTKLECEAKALEADLLKAQEEECTSNTPPEADLIKHKAAKLRELHARLSLWWRQRAKARWLHDGDQNTAFFHATASGRKRANHIPEEDDSKAMQRFTDFFANLWSTPDPCASPSLALRIQPPHRGCGQLMPPCH